MSRARLFAVLRAVAPLVAVLALGCIFNRNGAFFAWETHRAFFGDVSIYGILACGMALYAAQVGSLIEVVNRFGSYFYGSILGVFILAVGVKRANGHGATVGLIAGMSAVALVSATTSVAFLWLNVVGAVVVTVVGAIVSAMTGRSDRQAEPSGPAR